MAGWAADAGAPDAWLASVPPLLRWAAVRGAVFAHAYWIALGLTSMLTAREIYLSILALTYVTEPVVWLLARALLARAGVAPPPPTACLLTLLSADLTLEVELCGAFGGFLTVHVWRNRGGWARLGSRPAVALLGGAAPAAMALAGATAGVGSPPLYAATWALGFMSGALRAAAVSTLFSSRLALWDRVLHARYAFPVRNTIVA